MTNTILEMDAIKHDCLEKQQAALLPSIKSGKRGGVAQQKFLRLVASDSTEFCREILSWGTTQGEVPPVPENPLSENECAQPPWQTEQVIAETWSALSPAMAASPGTWTRIHVELIEKKLIKSSYLAKASNSTDSGQVRINRILESAPSDERAKNIDRCVRDVLRHMGGVPRARGNRTAYLDCPLAKAWWRHYYAQEAQRVDGEFDPKSLSDTLRSSVWDPFIEAMVSRLTIIGDQSIRPALVIQWAESEVTSKEQSEAFIHAIGQYTTVRALGYLSPQGVKEVLQNEIVPTISQP